VCSFFLHAYVEDFKHFFVPACWKRGITGDAYYRRSNFSCRLTGELVDFWSTQANGGAQE